MQSEIKQFNKLISQSKHILILLPENPKPDYFCTALAFAHFFDVKNIKTTIAFKDPYEQTSIMSFLSQPQTTEIIDSIAGTRDLILTFNTKYNKILGVKTEQTDDEFKIYVTPEKGMIDSRDFSFVPGKFPYDVIVTVGATDKEDMGKLYEEIPDIFYELPIINIDNKSANERFGQVNIVDIVASSTSEIAGNIIENIDGQISNSGAQCLLAGIINETHSFQNQKTTPQSMTLASRLIDYGANQQVIIRNLYRNLPFSLLQLWGKALSNLTTSEYNEKIIISSITQKDIIQTKAAPHHVYEILDKMKENYPIGKIFILLYEIEEGSFVALVNTQQANIVIDKAIVPNIVQLPNNVHKLTLTSKNKKDAVKEAQTMLLPYLRKIK